MSMDLISLGRSTGQLVCLVFMEQVPIEHAVEGIYERRKNWAVYDDGLKIWFDGELLAKIDPSSQFKYILSDLALWLRDNDTEARGWLGLK